ncbi:MAG: ABC transporter permease [Synechococcus sp. WH 8007]|nr:ABC transporter permease [Synechococcus sp. WH 8007]
MARPLSSNTLSGWQIQRNVISALVYRELKTRVSEVKFGVLGVFIEPLGIMAVFLAIFSAIRGNRGPLDVALFLACGILFFTLFNDIAIRSLGAMRANEALFFYKPVKPIDTVIARTLVECGLYSIVFIVIVASIFLIREQWLLDDFPLVMISFLCLSVTGFGVGLILMVAGHRYSSLHQFVPLAMRPLWFISAVFFATSSLPQWLVPLICWNPVVQAIELSRHAFSPDYVVPEAISLYYLISVAAGSSCLGLWIYRNNERLLLTR